MLKRVGGLLREHDFRHLWIGDALSQFGTRMSMLAMPLVGLFVLDASPFQVALLVACERAGFLLLGLPVGAWTDRLRCRPLLIAADIGRALLLASIPVATALGVLTLAQLYVVLLLVGVHTVVFDVAHQTYLPRLLERDDLVEGNAKLAANTSVAAVAGSGIGGYLVQWLTAPFVVLLDALTYLWSAIWLGGIRKREQRPERPVRQSLLRDIGDGLEFLVRHPILRPIAFYNVTVVLFQSANSAILLVFLVREIGLRPGLIGVLGMVGLVGAIVSSMMTRWLAARLGSARALLLGSVVLGVGFALYPLTGPGTGLVWFVVAGLLTAFGIIVSGVLQITALQQLCPDELLGRVSATSKVLSWGMMPLGSLLGGVLSAVLGMRGTLWLAGAVILVAPLWLLCSPLRGRHDV